MRKLLFPLLLLASCTAYGKYAQYLDGFIGMDKTALTNAWGVPDQSYQSDKNTESLTYKKSVQRDVPGGFYTDNINFHSYVTYTPGYTVNEWCDTTFIVQNDKVVKWKTEGNSCVKD